MISEKTENKFDRLKFKVQRYDQGVELKLEKEFSVLFQYPEFKDYKEPHRNKLIRYICFLYDPETPLTEDFPDLKERKDAAATEAGFARNKKEEWPKEVISVFELSDLKVTAMLLRFLRLFKNTTWTEICTQEQELESIENARWKNMNDATKLKDGDKLLDMADKRIKTLQRLKKSFFSDHNDLDESVKELERITPENAKRIMLEDAA